MNDMIVPASRKQVECGTLLKRARPQCMRPIPRACTVKRSTKPIRMPASRYQYTGSMERQRQKFKTFQNDNCQINYNSKGQRLSANGDVMSSNDGEWTDISEEVEAMEQLSFVHHFNWLGNAVNFKSTTPPAVSLAIIMSLLDPKGLTFGAYNKDLRKSTLFNNALATVDPVFYCGDPGVLRTLQGTRLQEAITGQTVKFYTKAGYWYDLEHDPYSEEVDVPEIDDLNQLEYKICGVVANGWFENFEIPTSRDFIEYDHETNMEIALGRRIRVLSDVARDKSASPLRNSLE